MTLLAHIAAGIGTVFAVVAAILIVFGLPVIIGWWVEDHTENKTAGFITNVVLTLTLAGTLIGIVYHYCP